MIRAIRNVPLAVIVLTVGGSAQQATPPTVSAEEPSKTKAAPCSAASTSSAAAVRSAPDLSEAAKKACDAKAGDYWDERKGCMWIVQLDGDGSNVLRID